MTDLATWLLTDGTPRLAAIFFITVAALLCLPSLIVALGRTEGNDLSENHDRLDLEANVAAYERLGREGLR